MKILNIIKNALKEDNFKVMYNKVAKRVFDKKGLISKEENLKWIESNVINIEKYILDDEKVLWEESKKETAIIKESGRKKLEKLSIDLGGGGHYPLLYYLVRKNKPKVIVETGVAAGFSSTAILSAIKKNSYGTLYSSDFPYFRLKSPEKFIGYIVDEELRENWELFISSDKNNLPKIIKKIDKIDLFHYDSDKSYGGRYFALELLKNYLSKDSVIIMDDIQDNSFFHDHVYNNHIENWVVLSFEGKFVGIIGE
tara:strand:+ start:321 stop:1082 length:762 start_codon:yes stop_codon:yes gene_type:complete